MFHRRGTVRRLGLISLALLWFAIGGIQWLLPG
jgi:hypothetical protein